MLKEKFKASSIHFFLSVVIVSFCISLIIYFWYPFEYLGLTRFKELTVLIISVDLVLGPVLTFVVFNPRKKSLRFDLAVIAFLQLSALAYGGYTLFQGHPVYITFNQDRFTVIHAKEAQPKKAKYDEYRVSKLTSAKLAFAKLPEEDEKKRELLFDALSGAPDLDQRVEYYEPYDSHIDRILDKSLDPDLIFARKNTNKPVKQFLDKHQTELNSFAFLPLQSASKFAIIVLDNKTAQPVTTIDIDPWTLTKK